MLCVKSLCLFIPSGFFCLFVSSSLSLLCKCACDWLGRDVEMCASLCSSVLLWSSVFKRSESREPTLMFFILEIMVKVLLSALHGATVFVNIVPFYGYIFHTIKEKNDLIYSFTARLFFLLLLLLLLLNWIFVLHYCCLPAMRRASVCLRVCVFSFPPSKSIFPVRACCVWILTVFFSTRQK